MQGPQEGPAASASVSTKLCDWKKSIHIMGLDGVFFPFLLVGTYLEGCAASHLVFGS